MAGAGARFRTECARGRQTVGARHHELLVVVEVHRAVGGRALLGRDGHPVARVLGVEREPRGEVAVVEQPGFGGDEGGDFGGEVKTGGTTPTVGFAATSPGGGGQAAYLLLRGRCPKGGGGLGRTHAIISAHAAYWLRMKRSDVEGERVKAFVCSRSSRRPRSIGTHSRAP